MTTAPSSPFSARNRREKEWIGEDFPVSARIGLLHLLNDAIDRGYLSGWPIVAKEAGGPSFAFFAKGGHSGLSIPWAFPSPLND
jgi:hypothetical protein